MDQTEFYKELVNRYVANKATEDELEVFFHLLKTDKLNDFLSEKMIVEIGKAEITRDLPVRKIPLWFRAVAASVLVLLIAGVFHFINSNTNKNSVVETGKSHSNKVNDILPGGNKAILTLGDGTKLALGAAANGTISNQSGVILKKVDGQLAYNKTGGSSKEIVYNTVTTPRGGQFQLVLSDGSKVWLNAASSLRYPVTFSGNNRNVELTGEGYFEVAKNAAMPFKVAVNNTVVEVLGTHFNINAYTDESVLKTTLLEGSVKVSKGNESLFIVPGEQAVVSNSSDKINVKKNVDLEEAVAWKNGKFIFQNADIKSIMRQLEKWYDVTVSFSGNTSNEEYVGIISRNVNISQLLQMLEKTGYVRFEIEGRKIIVK